MSLGSLQRATSSPQLTGDMLDKLPETVTPPNSSILRASKSQEGAVLFTDLTSPPRLPTSPLRGYSIELLTSFTDNISPTTENANLIQDAAAAAEAPVEQEAIQRSNSAKKKIVSLVQYVLHPKKIRSRPGSEEAQTPLATLLTEPPDLPSSPRLTTVPSANDLHLTKTVTKAEESSEYF